MQGALDLLQADEGGESATALPFHPAVGQWFGAAFGQPTPVQQQAWAITSQHRNALIAAPTGSGKTLAAFLSAINDLVEEALAYGLDDELRVLYVSPLKALSNDIEKNLEAPLSGICGQLESAGLARLQIRSAVRTGDTSAAERARMKKVPPHILVTTPESLFILLTSDAGRRMLASTRSVIVDELHACAGSKRGAHLGLSLERLDALCETPPVRIGLSATQKPIERMAELLVGDGKCEIVDTGHVRQRDLAIELPRSPLTPVLAGEVWAEIYDQLAKLAQSHRTTLIFVNQRRQAERVARALADRIGEEQVTAHHGSLAREHRLKAEQRLKAGQLKALVATASLELGIDIGDVDLVCQIGSPRAINAFLQRVGRSGHAVRAIPKGRLFPQSLDDLLECAALLRSVEKGELDQIALCEQPLDVLAQQIVAEVACQEWLIDDLYERLRRARPYRDLKLSDFEDLVRMLADGYSTRRGRRGALLHLDAVNRRLRGRRGAKLTAVTNAGVIPDQFDYEVQLADSGLRIGTLNEDFAFESLPGDIVQLGNTSYRILKVETSRVLVEDAKGLPPNMPFWFGEGLGRSTELSQAVSELRAEADRMLENGPQACQQWLQDEYQLQGPSAAQLSQYLHAARNALGLLPTHDRIVFERFFDEVGDTHLVIHSTLGSRINRAWGLALRKKFCRQFNFELQASALDDSLVLSLGPTHSFPLQEVRGFLKSASAQHVVQQAVLQVPMFPTRWRWAASTALAVARNRSGKRVPPQFQRADAEDLLTHAFPDAVACQDNLPGEVELPDHPLIAQTLRDCLQEVMDTEGMIALLRRIESGAVQIICRDLTAPSPLSAAILSARPYAFLDDGAAEERRTRAVKMSDVLEPRQASDLGRLDAAAIEQVRNELWPDPANADELHDALIVHGFLTDAEFQQAGDPSWIDQLMQEKRIACFIPLPQGVVGEVGEVRGVADTSQPLWTAAERQHELRAIFPKAEVQGDAPLMAPIPDADQALIEVLRSRMELDGPLTAEALAAPFRRSAEELQITLISLEAQGAIMRGDFHASGQEQWCERRRLARIHRYTRERRHATVEPVSPAAFMRFLFHWHGLTKGEARSGPAALQAALSQLEGYATAASAWESEILSVRLQDYDPAWLDQLCGGGQFLWRRAGAVSEGARKSAPVRGTPIMLLAREHSAFWAQADTPQTSLSSAAQKVQSALKEHGASFFGELVSDTGLLKSQLENALGELVNAGLVTSDGFSGLRALIAPADIKARRLRRGGNMAVYEALENAGRWSLIRRPRGSDEDTEEARIQHIAQVLLRRYGVVFRKVLEREPRLPPWRDLFYVLRRMEAREEIRGGRFVDGFAGEQFALPEAAGSLRRFREDKDQALVAICGSDPLNLSGIIVSGERVPAQGGNRILYQGGVPVGFQVGKDRRFSANGDLQQQSQWQQCLIQKPAPRNAAFRTPRWAKSTFGAGD